MEKEIGGVTNLINDLFNKDYFIFTSSDTESIHAKNKRKSLQYDIFDTELSAAVVNYYINGMSILEISQLTNLSDDVINEILDRILPYLD